MARRVESSFSAGELDPALQERTTLDKFNNGLGIARNCIIGKTGRVISRPSWAKNVLAKSNSSKCVLYFLDYQDLALEWGDQYVRVYNSTFTNLIVELSHDWTQDDLYYLQFTSTGKRVHIMREGKVMKVLLLDSLPTPSFLAVQSIITRPTFIAFTFTVSATGSTGYQVDYAVSVMTSDTNEETNYFTNVSTSNKLPIAAGQKNTIALTVSSAQPIEMRVYRRPTNGGAFGYIGSSFDVSGSIGNWNFSFSDQGQDADYTHQPPNFLYDFTADVPTTYPVTNVPSSTPSPKTGLFFQQRFVMAGTTDKQVIHASRTKLPSNFTREFPYDSTSALTFKTATDGTAKILRFFDGGPLVAFTTQGIYANEIGALDFENISMIKKGDWVIQENLQPIIVPGAVIFFDTITRAVIAMNYSFENVSFIGEDISIYSDHLFRNRNITSWTYSNKENPVIYCTMDDGSMIALSYQASQKMQAWTRFDTLGTFEYVAAYKDFNGLSQVFAVIVRNGNRIIEKMNPRYTNNLRDFIGMDSSLTYTQPAKYAKRTQSPNLFAVNVTPVVTGVWSGNLIFNDVAAAGLFLGYTPGTVFGITFSDLSTMDFTIVSVTDTDHVVVTHTGTYPSSQASGKQIYLVTYVSTIDYASVTPVTSGVWDGNLTMTCANPLFVSGSTGRVYRAFLLDQSYIDFTVVTHTSDSSVIVSPSRLMDSTQATGIALFFVTTVVSGLDHLEGQKVSILSDGNLLASPLNTIESYPDVVVTSGQITLPENHQGAIIQIGLPYVVDVQTLDIATVEQAPTLMESMAAALVYIYLFLSRGIYVSQDMPADNTNTGMEKTETRKFSTPTDMIGNAPQLPYSRREEVTISADWAANGRISMRSVDPYPFEILSVIPDIEIHRKGET